MNPLRFIIHVRHPPMLLYSGLICWYLFYTNCDSTSTKKKGLAGFPGSIWGRRRVETTLTPSPSEVHVTKTHDFHPSNTGSVPRSFSLSWPDTELLWHRLLMQPAWMRSTDFCTGRHRQSMSESHFLWPSRPEKQDLPGIGGKQHAGVTHTHRDQRQFLGNACQIATGSPTISCNFPQKSPKS